MKNLLLTFGILLIVANTILAQSPHPCAASEVNSTTTGFLLPRMTMTQMHAINSPIAGLMIYNTTLKSLCWYNGTEWIHNNEGGSCGTIQYGGRSYSTVIIGNKCWMAENLDIGTKIDGTNDQTDNGIIEKYCYDNWQSNCSFYGGLYQWDEMMQYDTLPGTQGICPPGWHIPTDDEWKILEGTVDSYYGVGDPEWDGIGARGLDASGNLKEAGTVHWFSSNSNATNSSGFTALPGGNRHYLSIGSFYGLGESGYYWSSTQGSSSHPVNRRLKSYTVTVERDNGYKNSGYSVRCCKD
ncbi:MAG: hypothetical protein K8R46_11470 [Pirellulales bacterium]|nr:hypothetical protein [Pirellulales bacterium]